jgi:hypothetical protein
MQEQNYTVDQTAAKSRKDSPTKGLTHAEKGRENGISEESKKQYGPSSYSVRHPAPEQPYVERCASMHCIGDASRIRSYLKPFQQKKMTMQ